MAGKKALIVKFGQIGDVIMAIPAAHELHLRGFDIHWMCGKAARPLLECYSWIRVLPVDDANILRGRPMERARAIGAFFAQVGLTRYDLCATLYFDRRFHYLTRPIRARRRVVLSRTSRAQDYIAGRHHTDECVRVLLGVEDSCRDQSASPVRPDRLPSFDGLGASSQRRIAIVPGGTRNVLGEQVLRRWPIENYVDLAGAILGRGWEVVILGGREDAWVGDHFGHLPVSNHVGRFSLPQFVRVCDACDAIITHDTGPLHLAGLSETPLIGLFGPTDPATRLPRRPLALGIWGGQGFACRPCYDGRDFAPCSFNGCLHQIVPALVMRELDRLLAERDQGLSSPWRIVTPDNSPAPLQQISPSKNESRVCLGN